MTISKQISTSYTIQCDSEGKAISCQQVTISSYRDECGCFIGSVPEVIEQSLQEMQITIANLISG